eukprot:6194818-Pleurochrysis_carterae.AAC.3
MQEREKARKRVRRPLLHRPAQSVARKPAAFSRRKIARSSSQQAAFNGAGADKDGPGRRVRRVTSTPLRHSISKGLTQSSMSCALMMVPYARLCAHAVAIVLEKYYLT